MNICKLPTEIISYEIIKYLKINDISNIKISSKKLNQLIKKYYILKIIIPHYYKKDSILDQFKKIPYISIYPGSEDFC